MRISTLALANLSRRKGKAAFLTLGIAIGIGTAVALLSLSGSIRHEIGLQLDQYGANIVVLPRSNSLALDYGGVAVSTVAFDVQQLTDEDARRIHEIPYKDRLSVVAPKLLGAVRAEGRDVLLAGVDFKNELRLKRWWHVVGDRPQHEDELLVGYEAAHAFGLIEETAASHTAAVSHEEHGAHAGDPSHEFRLTRRDLTLGGRPHRIAGVLSPTAGPEDRMIFASLDRARELLGKPGQLSLIEVSALCKDCPVEDIVAQISEKVPDARVAAIQQSVLARAETVERLTRFSAAVAAIVLAIGALLIFTTMTGSVVERTKEIGVLRAIGFRRAHIVKGLVIEVAFISLIGGLLGWGAGTLASWLALPYFAETDIGFELQPALALLAVAAALLIGILASLYPILRAARLDPSEAVRYV